MDYELQDFNKDVVQASDTVPIVIDFWAEWCGPCRQLGPVLEKLAGEARGRWRLVKIDTDSNPEIAAQFSIRGIPAVKMVYQKQLIAEFTGAQPEHVVRKWLEENLPESEEDESEEIMERIDALLSEGERSRAAGLLAERINGEASPDERIRYAMLLLPARIDQAEKQMDQVDRSDKYEIEFETLETIKHLRQVADGEIKPESDNDQALEAYLNGIQAFFDGEFEEALQNFIQALQLDRELDDDGARKACIACFTVLSQHHPLTVKYRRRFSMSLY